MTADIQSALDGRYQVLRGIGEGGMATVYLARDIRHDRDVALKVLRPELAAVIGVDRFLAEIKLTANLQHPHILPLFDSGSVGGAVYYVMPFIQGETLRGRIDREKQLPIADAVRIAREVASALDYAHRQGVVHRDIKPENILLHDGRALVADFGIALAASSADSRMTATGMSLGTPRYMAPEQAMGRREMTPACDVYALGATLYEMLVGEPPFTGATAQAVVARVLTSAPESLRAQRHTVPLEVEQAVLKSLEKLPADRFASAADFATALNVQPSANSGQGPSAAATAVSPGRRVLWAATTAALVIAAGSGGWFARARVPAPPVPVVTFDHITYRSQTIFNARFGVDGRSIVYSAAGSGTAPNVYVRRPDSPEREQLGTDNTHLLSVSAKGELAVLVNPTYLYHRVFSGTLATMPMGGGAPRPLKDDVREADWAPDGQSMAIIAQADGRSRLEYPVGTLRYSSEGYLSDPRVSPDGQRVSFIEHEVDGDDRGRVGVLELTPTPTGSTSKPSGAKPSGAKSPAPAITGPAVRMLTPEFPSVQSTVWSKTGTEVLFSAGSDVSHRAVRAVSLTGVVRDVYTGPGGLLLTDWLADGTALISREEEPLRLMLHRPGAPADSDVSWQEFPNAPVFSHDGAQLAFSDESVKGGATYSTMLRHADGSVVRLGVGVPIAFSPDNQWVLVRVTTTDTRLVLQPVGPGSERGIYLRGLKHVFAGGWYPDGRAILLCGDPASGLLRCYRAPIDTGAITAVTPTVESHDALLSPDGTQVVLGGRRYSGPLDSGQTVAGLNGRTVIRWSADGRALYVRESAFRVSTLSLSTGLSSPLLDVTPARGSAVVTTAAFAIADDPTRYAYVASEYSSKLFVIRGLR